MENINNSQVQNGNGTNVNENEMNINLRDIIFLVLNNWYWFVISIIVCLIAAGFIYKAQPKTYTATGTILVRDNGNNIRYSNRAMDQILNNMDLDNSSLTLSNEIYMLKSSSLMSQVVKRLGINYTCTRDDMFKKITYFEDAPVGMVVRDYREDRDLTLTMRIVPKGNNRYSYKVKEYKVAGEADFSDTVFIDDTLRYSPSAIKTETKNAPTRLWTP